MKKVFNQCNFYFVLITLCSLNGTLYARGGVLARSILIIMLLVSIFYTVKVNLNNNNPVYFSALNAFLVLMTIYNLLVLINGGGNYHNRYVTNTSFLFDLYNSLLPVYAFFYLTKKGLLTEKNMKFWFFIFILLAINSYNQDLIQQRLVIQELNLSYDSLTNNGSYIFLGLLPAVFFFNKKWLQYSLFIIIGYFILSSAKRGAILIFPLCLIWYIYRNTSSASSKKKISSLILGALLIFLGYYFFSYLTSNNDYFLMRVNSTIEGKTSGRDVIYSTLYNHLVNNTDIIHLIFGNGADGTLKIVGQYAHNDWLELIIDNGLIGVFFYIVYWICYYKNWKNLKNNNILYSVVGMMLLIYFLMTMFSMSYSAVSYGSSFILGYCLAVSSMDSNIKRKSI